MSKNMFGQKKMWKEREYLTEQENEKQLRASMLEKIDKMKRISDMEEEYRAYGIYISEIKEKISGNTGEIYRSCSAGSLLAG